MPLLAKPNKDGTFNLRGDTFKIKDKIKSVGGKWNGNYWVVSESSLKELGARREYLARVAAHCHELEETIWVDEIDVKRKSVRLGCRNCDTPRSCGQLVEILEVLED